MIAPTIPRAPRGPSSVTSWPFATIFHSITNHSEFISTDPEGLPTLDKCVDKTGMVEAYRFDPQKVGLFLQSGNRLQSELTRDGLKLVANLPHPVKSQSIRDAAIRLYPSYSGQPNLSSQDSQTVAHAIRADLLGVALIFFRQGLFLPSFCFSFEHLAMTEYDKAQKELSKSNTFFRRLRRTSLIASATATPSAAQATTPSISSFSSTSVISFPSDSFFSLLVAFAFIVFALQLLALCLWTIWIHPFIKGAADEVGKRSAARLGGEAPASAAPHGNHGDNKPSRSATE